MVVVFFVFVRFFFSFVVCFYLYLDSGGPHPFLKGGKGCSTNIFFVGRAVQSRTPHFIKVSHFLSLPWTITRCFHYTTESRSKGGVYVNVARGDRCYLSPCCWEDICPAGDNSSLRLLYRGREGD